MHCMRERLRQHVTSSALFSFCVSAHFCRYRVWRCQFPLRFSGTRRYLPKVFIWQTWQQCLHSDICSRSLKTIHRLCCEQFHWGTIIGLSVQFSRVGRTNVCEKMQIFLCVIKQRGNSLKNCGLSGVSRSWFRKRDVVFFRWMNVTGERGITFFYSNFNSP